MDVAEAPPEAPPPNAEALPNENTPPPNGTRDGHRRWRGCAICAECSRFSG
jgi:hypothetical protein